MSNDILSPLGSVVIIEFTCTSTIGKGSSDDPCRDNYRGAKPFSEVEIAALRDKIIYLNERAGVALYIDYHSYGQFWLTPYAFKEEKPVDYDMQVNWLSISSITRVK